MGRKRTKDKDLPPRVYRRSGALYFAGKDGRWTRLGPDTDRAACMRAYAEIIDGATADTFSAVAERYAATWLSRKAPKTQRDQRGQLDRLVSVFGRMPVRDIRRGHIAQYRDLRAATAPVAANRELALLSHIMSRCIEWELVDANPCKGLERLKERPRTRYVTAEEFLAVYAGASPLIQIMMALAILTGQRESDLLRVRGSDLIDDGISFRQGKTGKRLVVRWSDALRAVITQALELPKRPGVVSTYVLAQESGQPWTPDGFRTAWQKHIVKCAKAGLISERFTFHDLRGKAGSEAADQKLLGHMDPKILARVYRRKPELVSPLR